MSAPAPLQDAGRAGSPASLPLRLAQRAFAAVLDVVQRDGAVGGAFRFARLRRVARRTLSALSADDHARLIRWLAVQLAAASEPAAAVPAAIARVDAATSAATATLLARVGEELGLRGSGGAAVA